MHIFPPIFFSLVKSVPLLFLIATSTTVTSNIKWVKLPSALNPASKNSDTIIHPLH